MNMLGCYDSRLQNECPHRRIETTKNPRCNNITARVGVIQLSTEGHGGDYMHGHRRVIADTIAAAAARPSAL